MSAPKQSTDFEIWQEYGCDVKARRILMQTYFGRSPIGELTSEHIIKNLLWLDQIADKPIELWLHTPGGEVEDMWALYDAMQSARSDICTVAIGNVSSAGVLILAAGTPGCRYAMPNASLMHHWGHTWLSLEWLSAESRIAWERKEGERWLRAIAGHSGKPYAYWKRQATNKGELWLDAEEMVAHGLVDEIWQN